MATSLPQRDCIDGTDLAYEVRGEGVPVVLIHGGIVANAFAPLMAEPALTERYRLVHYHRRGYGQSARVDRPVSIEEQAIDCLALMRHLGIARAHVAGYSFGGAIGLQLALDAPGAVQTLALLEPTIPQAITDSAALEYFLGTIGEAFGQYRADDKAGAIDTWARGAFGPGYCDELERALPGAFAQAVADADVLFQVEAPALQQWRFGAEEAARVRQPVLSVYYDDANWAGFRQSHDALRAWTPRSEGFALPNATDLLRVTQPRAVAEALAAFFARHPVDAAGRGAGPARPPAAARDG